MRKSKSNRSVQSFAMRSILYAVTAIIITCVVLGIYSFVKISDSMNTAAENKVFSASAAMAGFIDGDLIKTWKSGDENTAEYKDYLTRCRKIKDEIGLTYLYVLTKDSSSSTGLIYLFDTDIESETPIGSEFEETSNESMDIAFGGKSAVTPEPYTDTFGTFKTGYAPVKDSRGTVVAVVAADYDIEYLDSDIGDVLAMYLLMCLAILVVVISAFTVLIMFEYRAIKGRLDHELSEIRDFSGNIRKFVHNFETRSTALADSVDASVSAVTEMSAAMEQTCAMANMNNDNTQKAASFFSEASVEMSESSGKTGDLINSIRDIEKSGDDISGVIEVINNISKKTKILALNAEVEAARVGEAGKGFAVVAKEVGELAQNSEDAAANTNEMIDKNGIYTKKAVTDIRAVSKILESVDKKISSLSKIIGEVSQASVEQTKGAEQIKKAISVIENTASDNAASASEIKTSSNQLAAMTDDLDGYVDNIKNVINKRK